MEVSNIDRNAVILNQLGIKLQTNCFISTHPSGKIGQNPQCWPPATSPKKEQIKGWPLLMCALSSLPSEATLPRGDSCGTE